MVEDYFLNDELNPVVLRLIEQDGLTSHIHGPMSNLGAGLEQIVTTQFQASQIGLVPDRTNSRRHEQRDIRSISFELMFTGTEIRPRNRSGTFLEAKTIDPWYCMSKGETYSVDIFVKCKFEATAFMNDGTERKITKFIDATRLCSMPVEVGGTYCNMLGRTRQQMYEQRCDPDLLDGMFIVGGSMFCLHTKGYNKYNTMHIYRNSFKKEIARATIICRPGIYKNSFQVMVRHLSSGLITIEVTAYPYIDSPVPFHIFFYMLGITSDRRIEEMILMSREDNETTRMIKQTLDTSYRRMQADSKYGHKEKQRDMRHAQLPQDVMVAFLEHVNSTRPPSTSATANDRSRQLAQVSKMLDEMFLVHQTAAGCAASTGENNVDLRYKKARILAGMIHDTIMISEQKIKGTDRDHLKTKNFQTPPVLLLRTFKTKFNDEVIKKLRDDLTNAFKHADFDAVDVEKTIRERLSKAKLTETFEREIRAHQDTDKPAGDRVIQSEAMTPPKSQIHVYAAKRTIAEKGIQSKQSERSHEIRRVHPSFAEFIDYITSPDTGENVGMPKQLAIMTTITSYTSPDELAALVVGYSGLTRWLSIDPGDHKSYTHVYINGDWFGGLREPHLFLAHFRHLRRSNQIEKSISITYETLSNRIDFSTDDGRLIRPFFIVYNNMDELDAFDVVIEEGMRAIGPNGQSQLTLEDAREKRKSRPQFRQWIKYDREWHGKILRREVKFEALIQAGIMEYITAEEMQNCYLSATHEQLWSLRHEEKKPFTHMTIPLSAFGVPALTATLPHLSQPLRHTFQTQMCKQTCGYTTFLEAYMDVKNMHCQMSAFMPINPTFANSFTEPGGYPVIICFMCARWNQEDSIVINEGFVRRGGFLVTTISKLTCQCIEQNEFFGQPDGLSMQIRNANYGKLKKGHHVAKGTIIEKDDVVVAKYVKQLKPDGTTIMIDKSEVYKHHTPAYVTGITTQKSDNGGVGSITIHYRILRMPTTGSKFSSRSGNKGVISYVQPESHLPTGLRSGRIADIYINTHSFPSRMLPGETISDWLGSLAASSRRIIAVTPFMELDFEKIMKEQEAAGNNAYGIEPTRDGRTGFLTQSLFMATSTRQCLQKFAEAEASARDTGKLSPITRQSLQGASNQGGQRTGEMEFWVTGGHGAATMLDEFQHFGNTYFEIIFCTRCKQRAIYNNEPAGAAKIKRSIYKCLGCRENANLVRTRSKFMTNSLMSYFESSGFRIDLKAKPYMQQVLA